MHTRWTTKALEHMRKAWRYLLGPTREDLCFCCPMELKDHPTLKNIHAQRTNVEHMIRKHFCPDLIHHVCFFKLVSAEFPKGMSMLGYRTVVQNADKGPGSIHMQDAGDVRVHSSGRTISWRCKNPRRTVSLLRPGSWDHWCVWQSCRPAGLKDQEMDDIHT